MTDKPPPTIPPDAVLIKKGEKAQLIADLDGGKITLQMIFLDHAAAAEWFENILRGAREYRHIVLDLQELQEWPSGKTEATP